MRRFLLLAVSVFLASCATVSLPGLPCAGCRWAGGGPATVSMLAADWDFRDPRGLTGHPQQGPGGSITFKFDREVDMLTTDVSIAGKDRVRGVFRLEHDGSTSFRCADGGEGQTPPAFGLFIEVANDDLTVAGDGRWWYEAARVALGGPAEYTIEAPFSNLGGWRNAGGKYARDRPAEFRSALARIGALGITFGCVSFAHGVFPQNGTATMTFVVEAH